jgi:branched-chain amino acid transport system ATP-binding protein
MLDVHSLSVSYGKHLALENAGILVGRGEIVVILGANGAGKSSLLKAISGISEGKVTGSVILEDRELVGLSANKIVEAGLALVPEGRGVFPDLSVQENLKLGAYNPRARDAESSNLACVLDLFPKLSERRRQVVRTMSGGEQQMVAVGRAMMSNPAILTLDEPSLGLSPLLCKDLFQSLKAVRAAGIGILLVEQNAKQSLAIADRGYLLENGRIVHEGRAEELMNDPVVQKAYLGGATSGGHTISEPEPTPALGQPTPARSLSRPAAQNPSDIAAAALAKFSRPVAPTTPQSVRPTSQTAPAVVHRAPQPPAPRAPTVPRRMAQSGGTRSASDILGVGIDELVARAASRSAERVSPRSGNLAPTATPMRANGSDTKKATVNRPSSLPEMKMPDLADNRDRLQSVLREIEEAAARARAYRPKMDK